MSGSPKATTNTPSSPTARTSCAAAPATTPRSWYGASSPPATTGPAPPTRSRQAPTARGISPTRYAASPTAAPTPFNPDGRPTGTGTRKPRELVAERQRWIDHHIGRDRSQDQGLDHGIDL